MKTILIVAFLALDAFLAAQLLVGRGGGEAAGLLPTRPSASELRSELALAGIRLAGEPPDAPDAMSLLRVSYADPDRDALVASLIPVGARVDHETTGAGLEIWTWGRERLYIYDQAFVFYTRGGKGECPAPAPAEARRRADAFLAARMGGLPPGTTFDLARVEPDAPCLTAVYYRQQYRAFPIWGLVGADAPNPVSGPFKVEVDATGVVSVVEHILLPIGFSGPPKPIIGWDGALTRLDQTLGGEGGLGVASVEVGYFSDVYCQVESYEIPPVWQVRLVSGEVYYVNAYTGEVEGNEGQSCAEPSASP
ncbi:MAG: hypothetical protein IRZ11_03355 [Clostridia bacterium]|nr:hypothetical protein [Clostridia bacterium]